VSDRPPYEELEKIRTGLEERIEFLEEQLARYADDHDLPADKGLFGELFQKAADMIIIAESDPSEIPGKIIMANPAVLIQLEYSLEEIQKMSFQDLLEGSERRRKKSPLYPESFKYEKTFVTKSGKKIHSDVYTHVFIYGQKKYAFAIIRDISERQDMEESLRHSEEKYKRLVESLSDEYIFYAHDTSGMTTYLSPSISRVLGYSQEEAMRNYREFYTDHEMNQTALRCSEESLKGNIQPPFMNELYHRDGSARIFNNTELPIYDDNGNIIGVEGLAHDITERIAAEEELKNQQEIFKLLVETIEEVFWIHDLKADRLLYVSPKYREVYGRSPNSLYHNPGSFLKVIHPEDIDFVKKAYQKISKGKGLDLEYRVIGKDGSEKLVWSRSFVLFDEQKRPSLSIGTALDITERKKAQREKNLLAAIVENLEDHAVIKDTSLRIIASNPANTKAAGKKSANQMIGKTDLDIYGDFDHVRQYLEDDRKALELKKGETHISDEVFVFPNGKKIHSLVKKFPVYDEKNNLIAVASISRDVTEYRNTLEELYKSEEKYRLLINNQGEGIGMVDPEENFLFANPRAEEIFGVARGKLEGRSLYDFMDKKGRAKIQEQSARRMKGEKDTYEMEIRRKGGEKRQIMVTASPQYQDNKFTGTFAIFRDVTERIKAEEELKKSERELRESNEAKDKFFSIIAHDLRSPFNSILSISDILLKDYSSYDKDEVQTFVRMINDASRQVHNLLENLLNWTRVQSGNITFTPTSIDIHETIESIFSLYESNAGEKNLELLNRVRPGILAQGDANMIQSVLRNLVSNAIKFTRPKGKVTVNAKTSKNCTDIIVSDTGIGIPKDMIDKLFRIDRSAIRTGTANEEGSGLGLALCMEFVKKNNGSISVTSKQGKGTSFSIRLPGPSKQTNS
jgi:PAS domain S-box-containing protein